MSTIAFLVNTSFSMCQQTNCNGLRVTYLDVAKMSIELFIASRQRCAESARDRYILLSFDDPPYNVKAGFTEDFEIFTRQLKHLQCGGSMPTSVAIAHMFDFLNNHRYESGIDTFNQGRCPFYLEPVMVVFITTGWNSAIPSQPIQTPYDHLVKDWYRWDQILFSLVLRMPGHQGATNAVVGGADDVIEHLCALTTGKMYQVKTSDKLAECIQSLVEKVRPAVVIHFEHHFFSNRVRFAYNTHIPEKCLIYQMKGLNNGGHWPIPELDFGYKPYLDIQARDAHPKVRVASDCCDAPLVRPGFPIDSYRLQYCPLVRGVLERGSPQQVWRVYLSTGEDGGKTFGYLKPNKRCKTVDMCILPYNYPMLLPLLDDLFDKYWPNPPTEWVCQFASYIDTVPQYYHPFLRRVFGGILHIPNDLVYQILPQRPTFYVHPSLVQFLDWKKARALREQLEHRLRIIKLHRNGLANVHTSQTYNISNPYCIPRRSLIDAIAKIREQFFQISASNASPKVSRKVRDESRIVPNNVAPLRTLLTKEDDERNNVGSDGAQNNLNGTQAKTAKRQRQRGPIMKDYVFRR